MSHDFLTFGRNILSHQMKRPLTEVAKDDFAGEGGEETRESKALFASRPILPVKASETWEVANKGLRWYRAIVPMSRGSKDSFTTVAKLL